MSLEVLDTLCTVFIEKGAKKLRQTGGDLVLLDPAAGSVFEIRLPLVQDQASNPVSPA